MGYTWLLSNREFKKAGPMEQKVKRGSPEDPVWWAKAAKVLRGEMMLHDVTTERLAEGLKRYGVNLGVHALNKKIHRGSFSFAFFLQCMGVMGVESLDLYLARDPKPIVTKSSGEPLDGKSLKLIDEDEPPTG